MKLFFKRQKTPVELIQSPGRIKNNISTERIHLSIAEQYKQLHDPDFAKKYYSRI